MSQNHQLPSVKVATRNTWSFHYTLDDNLPKGSAIEFDMMSKGGPLEWELPEPTLSRENNTIWITTPKKERIYPTPLSMKKDHIGKFVFLIDDDLESGESITFHIGSVHNDPQQGNLSQKYHERRRRFAIAFNNKGNKSFTQKEYFYLNVKGGMLNSVSLSGPSIVAKNERFSLLIRFEDVFGNLTQLAPPNSIIEISYPQLKENMRWKLFIPETGFVVLPNLYFNELGSHYMTMKNLANGDSWQAPPILCVAEKETSLFWGNLHSESLRYDSIDGIEETINWMRNRSSQHFFATSPLQSTLSQKEWKRVVNTLAEEDEVERFTTFSGSLFSSSQKKEGLH
ncbi:MAG: hypothetical protein VXZ72_00380, partial [Chlamydiota bacterium]|nr:hypothetical protein [Chlamydiota bacterium]